MAERIFQTGEGRIWLQKFGPRPDRKYELLGCAKLGGFAQAEGDITPIRCPDPSTYDEFIDVGEIRGAPELPTTSLMSRFGLVNYILSLKCPFDVQALYGQCKDPSDRVKGWQKVLHFNAARFTNRSSEDLSALQPDERASIMLTGDITAKGLYQIDPLSWAVKAGYDVTTQIMDIAVCDRLSCGDCGDESDGGNKIYALAQQPGAGSPAILSEIIFTVDGGLTWYNAYITTLAAAEQPTANACVGDYLLVVSPDSASLHYVDKGDLLTWAQGGSVTASPWVEVATGFVATKDPRAIAVVDASHVWIVGEGGYVYFTDDITSGVVVQDAGVATTQDLNAIHALNSQFVVAVGQNNAVIYTQDGGATWQSVTGPNPGVNLLSVWGVSESIWFVGTDNTGRLYYTLNKGQTWTSAGFAESGVAGDITDIKFSEDPARGWFSMRLASTLGRIYETIDGGATWYRTPQSQGLSLPLQDTINCLAVVNVNEVWAGGLADNGGDGIILQGVGYEG